jgi:hypothetical protein
MSLSNGNGPDRREKVLKSGAVRACHTAVVPKAISGSNQFPGKTLCDTLLINRSLVIHAISKSRFKTTSLSSYTSLRPAAYAFFDEDGFTP